MKVRTGTWGPETCVVSLAKMLFEIVEPILKARYHMKTQISGFS